MPTFRADCATTAVRGCCPRMSVPEYGAYHVGLYVGAQQCYAPVRLAGVGFKTHYVVFGGVGKVDVGLFDVDAESGNDLGEAVEALCVSVPDCFAAE